MKSVSLFRFFLLLAFIHSSPTPAAIDPKEKPATVFVRPAEKTSVADILTYPARIESKVNATVLSEFEGVVAQIHIRLGAKVQRGDTLFVIRHTDPVYEYAPVKIRAPVTGLVSAMDVSEGSLISKGQNLASVTDPKQLQVKIEIPASDLSKLSPLLSGKLFLSSSDNPLSVQIDGVSPSVDFNTGTATGILKLLGSPQILAPGLIGRVKFEVNQRNIFEVPENIIVYRDDKKFLKIVKDNIVSEIPIDIGLSQHGHIEVKDGLKAGILVIERSSKFVAAGDKVEIASAATPSPATSGTNSNQSQQTKP